MIRVTVWNEYIHEQNEPFAAELYPGGVRLQRLPRAGVMSVTEICEL